MKGILEIEREIERLPGEEFMELAAWMWQKAEDKGLLAACMEADAEPDERADRDEIFAILESP
jgi:hypothetical protein